MQHADDEWDEGSSKVQDLDNVEESLPPFSLTEPDDVKLTLWCQPDPYLHLSRISAKQGCVSASQDGFQEEVLYLKGAVISHFWPSFRTLLSSSEATAGPSCSKTETLLICTCEGIAEDGGAAVPVNPMMPRCQCVGQKVAEVAGCAVGGGLKELDFEVENADLISAAVTLLHMMYTGHVHPGVTPSMWLAMLQLSERWEYEKGENMCSHALCKFVIHAFPTLEVYEMSRTSPKTFWKCPQVLAVACQRLRFEFGDAQKVLGTPSLLKRFLKMPFTPVLVLMDRCENSSFLRSSRVELFEKWCSSRAGTESISELCTLTTAFPLKEVYSLLSEIHLLPCFSAVMQTARIELHLKYGSVSKTVDSPDLLQSFCLLPQPAVLILFKSEELDIGSEVTLLLLLDVWFQPKWNPPSDYAELISAVRYSRLPSSYLTHLLDSRRSALPLNHLKELWHYHVTGLSTVKPYSTDWYKPSRAPLPSRDRMEVSLSLRVSVKDLWSLLENEGSLSCPFVYAAGFLWRLTLVVKNEDVWYGFEAEGVTSLKTLQQGIRLEQGISRDVSCCFAVGIVSPAAPVGSSSLSVSERVSFGPWWGTDLCDRGVVPTTDPGWWSGLIQNGSVEFTGLISNIRS